MLIVEFIGDVNHGSCKKLIEMMSVNFHHNVNRLDITWCNQKFF